MACPHTSGVAALMISLAPGILTAQNVRDILSSTTDNINSLNPTYVGKMGTGRLNAYQALLATQEYIALTAKFTASPTLVCTGNAVTFTDLSLASPTSWLWSFPGGTPSAYNGQNPPAVIYPAAGVFDVSLTVSDGTTTDTETKTGYITVQNIIAGFTGTPTSVVVGNPVTFTDNSMCSPTSWSWSFPGGTPSSSTLQNPPPVTYSTLGTYDVSLSVTKSGKTDVETKTGYISVISPEFIMSNGTISTCSGNFYDPGGASGSYSNSQDFTMVFNPGSPGNKLRFIFNSFDLEAETSCGYDYLKIYNGNSTSSPLIGTYCGTNSPGTITASGATGSLTFVFHSDNYVVATGWSASIICISTTAPPVAGFVASTINPAINSTVVFTDQTINFPTSWAWSFTPNNVVYMNGTNAGSQNPQVQFTATGNYNVSLTVANAYGTDNETKTNYISVANCTPCSSSSSNASEEWISNVSFNTINNNSGGSAGYQDFTAISTTVKPGSVYNLSASCGSTGSWAEHCLAFFDWNHDCDFTDAGESFDLGQVTGPGTMNANITIPAGTADGLIRMRVSLKYNGDPTSCETLTYGQVEDYTVIVQNPSLSVTPSNQNVTAPAGNTSFGVTSNSVWTVASNQVWCAVTTSGSGNGTITATYLQNTSLSPRIANITVTVAGLSPVVVTVTQAGVPCFDPTAYAGADVTICENESYTIAGATAANFGALLWTGGFGSFDNPTQLTPVYTPGINEYGTPVALTLTAQPVSPCSFVASDQMTIFIQKLPTADAGNDATIIETENLQLSAVAENYTTVFWSSSGDGYFDDPDILNPVYFPGVMDIQNSTVDLYLTVMPQATCAFESVDILTLTIMRQQMLSLPAGWSGFSSFIVPQNPAFDEFMAPVAGDLVVVKTITQVYWPMFEVNTIGNFQVLQGYIVKMNAQASLPVTGFKSVDKTINLVTGWNILPVVSENETGYQELLTQLGGNLVIVKEIAGGLILWPEAGVYSLATLVPGKAYMIKVSAECSFTFPD
jgi:PKD repeat protein